jgi:hypothetical protein
VLDASKSYTDIKPAQFRNWVFLEPFFGAPPVQELLTYSYEKRELLTEEEVDLRSVSLHPEKSI